MICCCAKSPDFVPIAICRSYFSLVFVAYWNSYEVGRLRRAVTIIFCCCYLFILRRAGFGYLGLCISVLFTSGFKNKSVENRNSLPQSRRLCGAVVLRIFTRLVATKYLFCFFPIYQIFLLYAMGLNFRREFFGLFHRF